jgi:hypothetical protein
VMTFPYFASYFVRRLQLGHVLVEQVHAVGVGVEDVDAVVLGRGHHAVHDALAVAGNHPRALHPVEVAVDGHSVAHAVVALVSPVVSQGLLVVP